MKIFGLVGASGSGKTTLIVKLLGEFAGRGLVVSTIKHAHHGFELDVPGKDSWRHREAGAKEVMLASASRFALMHEAAGEPELQAAQLVRLMAKVDLLLIEGFKNSPYPKMEVFRPSLGKPRMFDGAKDVIAIASDEPLSPPARGRGLKPVFGLDGIKAIADFIIAKGAIDGAQ